MKECSECGEWSAGSAKKCKHCGVSFDKYKPKEVEDVVPDEFEDDDGVVLTREEVEEFGDVDEEVRANGQQRKRERDGVYIAIMMGGALIGAICGGLLGYKIGGFFAYSSIRGSVGGYIGMAVGGMAAHFLYILLFERDVEE